EPICLFLLLHRRTPDDFPVLRSGKSLFQCVQRNARGTVREAWRRGPPQRHRSFLLRRCQPIASQVVDPLRRRALAKLVFRGAGSHLRFMGRRSEVARNPHTAYSARVVFGSLFQSVCCELRAQKSLSFDELGFAIPPTTVRLLPAGCLGLCLLENP